MQLHFPLKSYSVKSTDDPWVTDHYRKEARKCREEYKKNGKSERYYRLKRENKAELAEDKKKLYDRECGKLTAGGAHAVAFNALKRINKPSCPKPWKVTSLYPDEPEPVALEHMADFFNKISPSTSV